MRFVQQLIGGAFPTVLAVLVVAAIVGAFIALCGGMSGSEGLRSFGGAIAGFGAIGFFALLFSPLGEIFSHINILVSQKPKGKAN